MKARWTIVLVACAVLALGPSTRAYWNETWHWAPGIVPVYLQQGSPGGALIDGSPDWDSVTEGVLATWNTVLNGVVLKPIRDPDVPAGIPSDANNVIWSNDVYGDPFGEGILAITLSMYQTSDNALVEADVIFNGNVKWNSYRGNVRREAGGATLNDLRRVALHEFGHFVGLGHPDDHDQTVVAVMNSHIGDIDTLQDDDVKGVTSIYGPIMSANTLDPASHPRSTH